MDRATRAFEQGLLRNRSFLAIWGAQILSQTAANALTSALIVLVFAQTKANTASSFLILLAIVPAVIFGPLAGVMVDRTDRKLVLYLTNLARGFGVLLLVPLTDSVPAAYLVNFLVATATVFFVPAEAATLPKIVRKRDLLLANSLFSLTFNGSFLLGFSLLAPALIALFDFDTLFIVLAVMYFLAALLITVLPKAEPVQQVLGVDVAGKAVTQTQRDIRAAIRYLNAHRRLSWVLGYVALTYMLIAVAGALTPGFVTETLDLSEREVYVLSFPAGLCVAAGLVALNLIGRRLPRADAIHWGLLVTAVSLLGLAAARPALRFLRTIAVGAADPQPVFIALVIATAVAFGAAYAFITVPSFTLLQEELADDMRGRVFAVLNTLVSVVSLVPLLIVGSVADRFGVGPVLAFAGVVVLAVWIAGRGAHLPRDGIEAEPSPA